MTGPGPTGPDGSSVDGTLFRIDWNRHGHDRQQAMMEACARPTLPQAPAYAAALAEAGHATTEFGLLRFHGRPVGYVFVELRPLVLRFSSCRIYRGPLWLDGDLPGSVQGEFFRLIRQRYRLRNGRPVTFHPELADTPTNRRRVAATGFRRIAQGYATIWLDLTPPLDALRAGLDQRWRNRLNQAERHGLELEIDTDGDLLDWTVARHEEHMAARHYQGPSRGLLEGMMRHGKSSGLMRIMRAHHDGEPVAAIIVTRHGRSATYFVGWNGSRGRELRAHHFLLWQAIAGLRDEGVAWFDLGGVNDADAASVARFKSGISDRRTVLVGAFT